MLWCSNPCRRPTHSTKHQAFFFRQNVEWHFCLLPPTVVGGRSSSSLPFVHHKVSGSNNSRTVLPRITKFYADMHTARLVTGTNRYEHIINSQPTILVTCVRQLHRALALMTFAVEAPSITTNSLCQTDFSSSWPHGYHFWPAPVLNISGECRLTTSVATRQRRSSDERHFELIGVVKSL